MTHYLGLLPGPHSPGQGALGSLDFTKDERRILAARANKEAPAFGSAERQRVIDDMHRRMLERVAAAQASSSAPASLAQV